MTLARRGPTLATLVRPRSEDLFLWSEDLFDFVRRRLRSDFSRFDPASPGDGPTLATLLAAWIEDLFAEAPVGAGWGPRRTLAYRGPRRPTLAGLVPICARHTLADLTPKYPTLATSTPGCLYRVLLPTRPSYQLPTSELLHKVRAVRTYNVSITKINSHREKKIPSRKKCTI